MLYLAELYYLQDQKDFPFHKAVCVTATAISHWSRYFHAKLISPMSKHIGSVEKSGPLPENALAREAFVSELVSWLFENALADDLFCLLLDDEPTPKPGKVAKFDHHDDTCCWVLNLSEIEFSQLQSLWRANGLPEDLFYPEQRGMCVPYPGTGLKAWLLRVIGVQKCYTPKQWQSEIQRRAG